LLKAIQRVTYSLRIIDCIFKRYENKISFKEEQNLNIQNFLNSLLVNDKKNILSTTSNKERKSIR